VSGCQTILEDENARSGLADKAAAASPEIKQFLDAYVIGQTARKKKLAVAVYNQYQTDYFEQAAGRRGLSKSNILLIGPPNRQTFGADAFAHAGSSLRDCGRDNADEAGYVGEDVGNII